MTHTAPVTIRDLTSDEAARLLERNHVGRIAYTFHSRVDIEPIGYVYDDGVIYMRTSPGSKLATLAHAPWVAFEVDEARGPLDWRSVVVHGTVYVVPDGGSALARASHQAAVEHLRRLDPRAFGTDDPIPERLVVLTLRADSVRGREARSSSQPNSRHLVGGA